MEVLLSAAVFALVVTGLGGAIVYGQQSTALAGAKSRATFIAEEGLEAVRNMRDKNYTNLTDGPHGLAIVAGNWVFSGTSDVTDIFTRTINVSQPVGNRKLVTSTVTWQQNAQRTGSVVLTTYVTNWRSPAGGGNPADSCTLYCALLPAGYSAGTCRANIAACTANGEVYEAGGNYLCTSPTSNRCCCLP